MGTGTCSRCYRRSSWCNCSQSCHGALAQSVHATNCPSLYTYQRQLASITISPLTLEQLVPPLPVHRCQVSLGWVSVCCVPMTQAEAPEAKKARTVFIASGDGIVESAKVSDKVACCLSDQSEQIHSLYTFHAEHGRHISVGTTISIIHQVHLASVLEYCFINSNRFSGSSGDGPVSSFPGLEDICLWNALETWSYYYRDL